jgi:hypothetical protein
MSEQLPAPGFDTQNYARPNDQWICGRACEGKSCRLGPDAKGRCRATAECVPVLEKKPGEAKGRWRCTRPGGACESGPLPDGSCCRQTPKCSPVPTLRTLRGRVTLGVVAATCAVLLIALGSPWRGQFINPGELSTPHSGEAFINRHPATNRLDQTCAACHSAGASGPSGLVNAAFGAHPGPFDVVKLAGARPTAMTAIDGACQKCHVNHSSHQAVVTENISCSYCHVEHRGAGPMLAPSDRHCAVCHGDAVEMNAFAAKGAVFTQTIDGFATDHPEFRLHVEKRRDPNTLKFNHALHLTGETIPRLPGGQKLDCADCHQPDAAGNYLRPVSFENNCRVCHSLQFDPETPGLQLPHGSPEFVSAFLRSLPRQYADLAARSGIAGTDAQNQFAQQKLQRWREQVESGEALERRIFLSTSVTGPEAAVGTVSGATRALYPGCAYCHEVKAKASGSPEITKPVMFERWLAHSDFNHAKHATVACAQCHQAGQSKDTADVILPRKETCVACHSPRGGVADACTTCHVYHHQKQP